MNHTKFITMTILGGRKEKDMILEGQVIELVILYFLSWLGGKWVLSP